MPHLKRSAKKPRQEDIVYEEPPMDHPLAKYFGGLADLNRYQFNFAKRKEIPPRYLDINLLVTQNFHSLEKILDDQGLMEFVQIRDIYYPKLVSIAYSTLSIDFNEENAAKFTLNFRMNKKEYEINSTNLAKVWKLDEMGCLYEGTKALENWGPLVKRNAYELFNIQREPGKKLSCSVFDTEMRVLHYLINYVLMPRSTGHGHVHNDDVITMWAMVNEIKINWTYFIAQHMIRFTKSDHSKGIGYVYLWTLLFKHFGIDLSNESRRNLTSTNVIDIHTLHHMGRAHEEQGQAQQASPPPQNQVGPLQQPSMLDLMQVLQRIEQNQERMNRHLQRVDRRIYKIEQHLEIEEDEDEDQV
ncbi:hypothetical protein PIB30_037496 [Stylosanthes scabra]|uniref:Putative plant transposon protein domain-containing protein n=1 Tax=Stylosanthes scabra TaxID=79078 RepID=A0ABU6XBT5_9FABA|nr:hypothetical protein [Stylosanthes scabra]